MTRRNGLVSTLALLVAGAIVGTMVVSCGIRPSTVIRGQEAPHGTVTSLIVYLLQHGSLRAVSRPLPPTPSKDSTYYNIPYPGVQDALNALMAGPTAAETAGGLTSELPSTGAGAYMLSGESNVYQVYIKTPDGGPISQHAVDQVVCTVAAAFTSTGYRSEENTVQVQVLDSKGARRSPQTCPMTP
ncbi:hypothetical protein [Kutzneria sp. CA-103260]|uniref:hypothetical protein n=1 Tax=Kutzneria sp. CA-103260 TaxID=2802641 RepID=UPI001BA98E78|nr:hypothetical protein [Kutzneria sp. CA-103260]QUQ71069.1 hypothetical protein JJ691_88520 [Kutzneria sp. CA-103260]